MARVQLSTPGNECCRALSDQEMDLVYTSPMSLQCPLPSVSPNMWSVLYRSSHFRALTPRPAGGTWKGVCQMLSPGQLEVVHSGQEHLRSDAVSSSGHRRTSWRPHVLLLVMLAGGNLGELLTSHSDYDHCKGRAKNTDSGIRGMGLLVPTPSVPAMWPQGGWTPPPSLGAVGTIPPKKLSQGHHKVLKKTEGETQVKHSVPGKSQMFHQKVGLGHCWGRLEGWGGGWEILSPRRPLPWLTCSL